MERDHGPSYRLILERETSQARIGSAAAAFFGEREGDCEPRRVTCPAEELLLATRGAIASRLRPF